MKMPRRSPCFEDLLTTADSQKNGIGLFTDRTSARSIAFKSYQDINNQFAQELYYKKLYNSNKKKELQLAELEEAIKMTENIETIDNNALQSDIAHKEKLERQVHEYDGKMNSELEFQKQLKQMIKTEKRVIV